MTSIAAKKRAKRQSRRLTPVQSRKTPISSGPKLVASNAIRHKTGIEWMAGKKRLTQRQARAGTRYGLHYRLNEIHGMDPLRSCLNDEPRGGGSGAMMPAFADEHEAVAELLHARQAMGHHAGMVAACDVICGRGLTPWEAVTLTNGNQRDMERLQTILAVALDLLADHYDRRHSQALASQRVA